MNQTPFLTAFLDEKSLLNDENFQDFLLLENIQLKRVDYHISPQIEKRGEEIILICSYNMLFHDFLDVLFQYYILEFPEGIPESHDFYQLVKKLKTLHQIFQDHTKFSDEKFVVFAQKMNQLSTHFSQPCKIFYDSVVLQGDVNISLLENTPFDIIVQGFQNEIEHIIRSSTQGVIDENQLFEDPKKHLQIAKYYFEKGDYESADIVCNQIIEQYESQPKISVGACFLLAEIAYYQGDFSGSQALLEKVFFLDKDYRRDDFLCYMGRIFSKQKNIKKLKTVLDEMIKKGLVSVEFYQLQAIYHLLGKNFNEVMNTYKTGLELFPESQELMYDLGCVYVKVFHNFDIGYQIALRVIKKNIKNISYWQLLETCFRGLDWHGAQEIVREIIYILKNGFPKIKNEREIFLFESLESGNIDKIFELIFQKNTLEKRKR